MSRPLETYVKKRFYRRSGQGGQCLPYIKGGYGASLVLVDQWFPSSKTCSNCGHKKYLPLAKRTYDCPACGI
jgi:hypothetical protein